MTAAFKLDLSSNTLEFADVAKGQIVNLKADLLLRAEGPNAYGGLIEGNFIGDIKGTNILPNILPHQKTGHKGFNIAVVGVGGTGGYLVRDLTRFIFALKSKGDMRPFNLAFIDPDYVETKNILRQNFSPNDNGKSKAEVMAKRYSSAFGLEIQAIVAEVGYTILQNFFTQKNSSGESLQNIIIGCVDNNKARREIKSIKNNFSDIYWIDSGNETKSGQVILGYHYPSRYSSLFTKNNSFYLPDITDLYPEVDDQIEDKIKEEKISCAERTMVDTQNIFVNMSAAGYILNFVRQIILEEPITISGIEFNIKGVTTPRYITESMLKTAAKGRQ